MATEGKLLFGTNFEHIDNNIVFFVLENCSGQNNSSANDYQVKPARTQGLTLILHNSKEWFLCNQCMV